jgi:hypothetical protein
MTLPLFRVYAQVALEANMHAKTTPCIYHIVVEGDLSPDWSSWLNGLSVTTRSFSSRKGEGELGTPCTLLAGPVRDQAALRSILTRIWNMNLTVVSVNRVEVPTEGV